MVSLFDLRGQTALIFGGYSTLGREMAAGLAEHGADLALFGRDQTKLYETVRELKDKYNIEVKGFTADVSSKASLQHAYKDLKTWRNTWSIILYSPGVNSSTDFFDIEESEWDHIMDVNLKGLMLCAQLFTLPMKEQGEGGSFITISSVSSVRPLSKVLTYSISKAGVNNMTQYLARELAPYNIRFNAIIPGFFPAEQNKKILSDDRIQTIISHTPMKRFGDPSELKGITVWLASKKASGFVTGALIPVDGGFTAMTI